MYHTVARVGEIAEGRGLPVEIEGRVIAVFLDERKLLRDRRRLPAQGSTALRRNRLRQDGHLHLARLAIQPGRRPHGSIAAIESEPIPFESTATRSRSTRDRASRRDLVQVRAVELRNERRELVNACCLHRRDRAARGDQGRRTAGARARARPGARAGPRRRAQPDRSLHPVGAGRDAAVVSLRHRLRPGGHGRASGAGLHAVPGRAIASGARTRDCSAARASRRSTRPSTKNGSIPTPGLLAGHRGRGDGPGRHHGPPRPLPVRPAQAGRDRSTSRAAPAASARWWSRWPRRPARGSRPPPAAPSELELCRRLGADLALNYKTDDIPARLREFAPEGVDVWYETQREPNLEVSDPPAPQARPDDPDGRPRRPSRPCRWAPSIRGTARSSASPCSTRRPRSSAAAPTT